MGKLFEEKSIGSMVVKNRFVRSATWEGMATPEGVMTEMLVQTIEELAKGEVGLIISGHTFVSPEGQASPLQLGVYDDSFIPGLTEMVDVAHNNGAKIVLQLAHAGVHAPNPITNQFAFVISDFPELGTMKREEMTEADFKRLANAFGSAAKRAKEAGFDGVQMHAGHGYLLSQSLSNAYNKRDDSYGGSIENRSRLLLEVYGKIREAVGKDYPVLIKMNSEDCIENGLTVEESLTVASMLEAKGLDAVELSGGTLTSGKLSPSRVGINKPEKEAYFQEAAKQFKSKLNIPVILVGGMRSFEKNEELVDDDVADFISMSRPFIREPQLIKRWKEGDLSRPKCLSDNLCFGPAMKGEGIRCVTEERQKAKE
jgi:2,4-dienoyl-CoA reductase-like NADH-dependent reductase (Old Yellow Enzyme family)